MEETVCSIEIVKDNKEYTAIIQSNIGGRREYSSKNPEDVLEQLMIDLQDEFETME